MYLCSLQLRGIPDHNGDIIRNLTHVCTKTSSRFYFNEKCPLTETEDLKNVY